jgi:hypothetical protein
VNCACNIDNAKRITPLLFCFNLQMQRQLTWPASKGTTS